MHKITINVKAVNIIRKRYPSPSCVIAVNTRILSKSKKTPTIIKPILMRVICGILSRVFCFKLRTPMTNCSITGIMKGRKRSMAAKVSFIG